MVDLPPAPSGQKKKKEIIEVVRITSFSHRLADQQMHQMMGCSCRIGCSNTCRRIRDIFSTIFSIELKPPFLSCHHITSRKKSHFGNLAGRGVLQQKKVQLMSAEVDSICTFTMSVVLGVPKIKRNLIYTFSDDPLVQ